jgi:hypothetical protein
MFDLGRGAVGALVALAAALAGCAARSGEADVEGTGPEIREWSEYVATYANCIGRLSSLGAGDPRIAGTRARFVESG